MANKRTAEKEIRKNIKRQAANLMVKSKVRTYAKKIFASIKEQKSLEEVLKALSNFESVAMKAAKKNIFNKNTISRIVSRMTTRIKKAFPADYENNSQKNNSN